MFHRYIKEGWPEAPAITLPSELNAMDPRAFDPRLQVERILFHKLYEILTLAMEEFKLVYLSGVAKEQPLIKGI